MTECTTRTYEEMEEGLRPNQENGAKVNKKPNMGINLGKAIVVLLVVWLLVIILMTGPLYHTGSDPAGEHIARQLTKATEQLELLKKQNEEFRALLADFRQIGGHETLVPSAGTQVQLQSPQCNEQLYRQLQVKLDRANELLKHTEEMNKQQKELQVERNKVDHNGHESGSSFVLHRRVERGVNEMWFFVNAQLKKLNDLSKEQQVRQRIGEILEDGAEHKSTIIADLRNLSRSNGQLEWAAKEMKELSDLIQRRIYYLQNPLDCKKAKKAICNLNKGCGYGCQLHHAVYCFLLAYGTERTLILRSKGWRYNKQGWEAVFQPVSETCLEADGVDPVMWPGTADSEAIQLPIVDSLHPRPDYLPLAIPKDLADRLTRFHGDPTVWWIAQFVKYLARPREQMAAFLSEMETKMKFERPIVGVHVRRTDKVGTEAAFHKLEEYMEHVEDYYRTLALETHVATKRVYLASDDPSVLEEARKRYPNYVFLGDPNIAKSASMNSRYSDDSLRGIIADIHLLSKCDYLVCTFSSQVCRVAYEVMQTLHTDASGYFYSLDDIYYFGGQSAHNQRALQSHKPREGRGEIALEKGDIVGIAGNHWDGYSKGINRRTGQEGLYPSFKAEEALDAVQMPNYPQAEKQAEGGA